MLYTMFSDACARMPAEERRLFEEQLDLAEEAMRAVRMARDEDAPWTLVLGDLVRARRSIEMCQELLTRAGTYWYVIRKDPDTIT